VAVSDSTYIAVAGIALGGTIIGSLIAGVAAALTARGNRKAQEKAIKLQYESEHEKLLRTNRIDAFTEFLVAVDKLDNLRQDFLEYHRRAEIPGLEPPSDAVLEKANNRMWIAYRKISLLSAKDVEGLALKYAQYHDECASKARDNEARPGRPDGVTAGALSKLMRIELGVAGGREVSLGTGLYEEPIGIRKKPTP
jgi:hypothetical protein